MRNFLYILFKFISIAIIIYVLLLLIWGFCLPHALKPNLNYQQGGNGFLQTRLFELKQKNDIDVFVFGSSHTYRGFDPRIFGKHSIKLFNMGSSMQTPIQTNTLINQYINKISGKKVILEVYPYLFTQDGVESSVDLIANGRIDKHAISMAFKINNIKTYNTLIFGFFNNLLNKEHSIVDSKNTSNDTYVNGGFVEKQLMHYSPKAFNQIQWQYNKDQFEAFSETIKLLKEHNVKVALVYAPIPKVLYSAIYKQKIFHHQMESYGKYYNFNEYINLNDSLHFFDANHLNQTGVELFNEKLISVLKEDSFFKHQ